MDCAGCVVSRLPFLDLMPRFVQTPYGRAGHLVGLLILFGLQLIPLVAKGVQHEQIHPHNQTERRV
ncbi:MAG: hypothetical protein SFW36_19210 [Leptolyngbyaceae cyanobacterium bins.59]|nr:hypothetical protein [Leptolyngbyaceae cyanobacterium bins.59]